MKKENSNVKAIFGIYFKTNKKRLILTVITSIIIFTLLTTFLLTWFNYRYKYFSNSVELYDWQKDDEISVSYYDSFNNKIQENSDYFNLAINEMLSFTDKIAPGMFTNFTACLFDQIFSLQYTPLIKSFKTLFVTFQQDVYEFIGENLIEGRMPNNKFEVVYRPNDITTPTYQLGDEIGLLSPDQASPSNNFTIVGIVGDLLTSFHQAGYSYDVLRHISIYQVSFYELDYLFTSPEYYVDIFRNDLDLSSQEMHLFFDFDYQFTIENIRSLKEIANKIIRIQSTYQNNQYLPSLRIDNFCSDLESFIYNFYKNGMIKPSKFYLLEYQ
ncbi:MAG: hypothetical protein JXA54_15810 [Candidatus Heimdallarchaeota archaeon]|nr:hypothetical protein [Candidatus Heimdallarchaeota archaeon]